MGTEALTAFAILVVAVVIALGAHELIQLVINLLK